MADTRIFLICVGQEKNLLQLWDLVKELNTDFWEDDRSILLKLLSYSVKKLIALMVGFVMSCDKSR